MAEGAMEGLSAQGGGGQKAEAAGVQNPRKLQELGEVEEQEGLAVEAEAEVEGEEEGEEGEEVEWGNADVEVSVMLLGSVTFVMLLFYLVNWSDDDIRRYTWQIISITISIFTAVLIFGGFNQVLSVLFEGQSNAVMCVVHLAHCFLYIVVLQVVISVQSGAMFEYIRIDLHEEVWVINDAMVWNNGTVVSEEIVRNKHAQKSVILDEYGLEVPVHKKMHEYELRLRRMRCWATLLAHMSGFAAIFAGGSLQHLEVFRSSPMRAFVPVVIMQAMLQVVFWISKSFRELQMRAALQENRAGVRAKLCNDEVNEAENDISSLSVSFLTIQVVRFAMMGLLPNEEGLEPQPEKPHPERRIAALYIVGLLFMGLAVTIVAAKRHFKDALPEGSALERLVRISMNSNAMCFAWCILWATRYAAVRLPIFHLPSIMGRVMLALELSGLSCAMVFAMDTISDHSDGGQAGKAVIKTIISALGILVGFSWEHCFDGGVAAVASTTPYPVTIKLALGLLVAVLIVPAWRRHILVKAMQLEWLKEKREEARAEKRARLS